MAYTEVSVSGYNASPPPDDGTAVASNEVTWAGIKTKLADPIKTAFDTCQSNITSVVSSEIEVNLWAPATTAMTFNQTAAPTNWTKSTTHTDKIFRVTSGTVSSGGTTAFSSLSAASISAHTLTSAEIPSHTHAFTSNSHTHGVGTLAVSITDTRTFNEEGSQSNGQAAAGTGKNVTSADTNSIDMSTPTAGTITGSLSGSTAGSTVTGTTDATGSGGSHVHTWGISPQYVDLIIATKD